MMKKLGLSPFLRNILLTTITSAVTVLSVVIITRLLARGLGPAEFGAYSLARRIVATIIPLSTFTMGVSVARYIGLSKDDRTIYGYLLSGLFLGVSPGLILLVIGFLGSSYLTSLLYHDQAYTSLFMASLFMVLGGSFYTVLSAFYRGQNKMLRFNLWQSGVMAFGPLIVALLFAKYGKASLIILLAGGIFYISLIPLLFHVFRAVFRIRQFHKNIKMAGQLRELFLYGFPRIPGDLIFAGLFTIGPFLAPYFASMEEAGYLIIGQLVIRIVENGVAAFGLVALPKVTQLMAEGRDIFLKERIEDIVTVVFHLGLFMAIHLLLWTDRFLIPWLGVQYTEAVVLTRVLLAALVPYLAYIMLRSIIDAVEEKAVNAMNLFVALIVTVVSSLILVGSGLGTLGLAIGTTAGFVALGVLSVFYLWRFYQIRFGNFMIGRCLLLNAIFLAAASSLKYLTGGVIDGVVLVSVAFVVEILFFALYCLILRKWNVRWMLEIEKRLIRSNESS